MERSKTILVVDDERILRDLLKRILTREGYRVITANDGETAIQRAKDEHPDLIVMDLRMPGIDGVEVLKRLKEMDPSLEFIMMTAYGSKELARRAMKLGARDFISKPFDVNELKETIEKHFELADLSREVKELREGVAEKKTELAKKKSSVSRGS